VDKRYYPRQVGERRTLSKNDRREQKKEKNNEDTVGRIGE